MQKSILDKLCTECGHAETHEEFVCDTCGKQLSTGGFIIRDCGNRFPIELEILGAKYDFCTWKCILQFIIAEIKKEKPNENNAIS